jgi:hypothetical protein
MAISDVEPDGSKLMFRFLDTTFDARLSKDDRLKWLPWVGDKYQSAVSRVLILGESNYNWADGAAESLANPFFSRELIEFDHGMNRHSKQKFFRNIERVLFQESHPDGAATDCFWRSVGYLNLVQHPMANKKTRPTDADYGNGWGVIMKVLPIIKPSHVLFGGTDWRKYNAFKVILGQIGGKIMKEPPCRKISNAYGRYLICCVGGMDVVSIVFMMHPSGRNFSWKKWGPFIFECVPDVATFIGQIREAVAK